MDDINTFRKQKLQQSQPSVWPLFLVREIRNKNCKCYVKQHAFNLNGVNYWFKWFHAYVVGHINCGYETSLLPKWVFIISKVHPFLSVPLFVFRDRVLFIPFFLKKNQLAQWRNFENVTQIQTDKIQHFVLRWINICFKVELESIELRAANEFLIRRGIKCKSICQLQKELANKFKTYAQLNVRKQGMASECICMSVYLCVCTGACCMLSA